MPQFDIVFEKIELALREDNASAVIESALSSTELDEIEELRRFSAELQEPEPPSFTST